MAAELDKDAEVFKAKWQARLKLSDREALSSYMRGAAADAAGYDKLDDTRRDQTYLCIRVDGRGLDGSADPGAIPHMVRDWQRQIDAEQPADPRAFTKRAITEAVGRNIHLEGEVASLVACASLWIAYQDMRLAEPLSQGNVTLFLTFTFDDEQREARMRMELGFNPEDIT